MRGGSDVLDLLARITDGCEIVGRKLPDGLRAGMHRKLATVPVEPQVVILWLVEEVQLLEAGDGDGKMLAHHLGEPGGAGLLGANRKKSRQRIPDVHLFTSHLVQA